MQPLSSWSAAEGARLVERFAQLPDPIRSHAAVAIRSGNPTGPEFEDALDAAAEAGIPLFVELTGNSPSYFPPASLNRLLKKHVGIAGVIVAGFQFNVYDRVPGQNPYSTPPQIRWAVDIIDVAAQFGRRFVLELDGVALARLMANDTLPFHVTLLTNENEESQRLVRQRKQPFSSEFETEPLDHEWPRGVLSLSDTLREDLRSWSLEVELRTTRGETYRNRLVWSHSTAGR